MSAATTPLSSLTVIEFYDLLSVCCFRPPLLGSSYPPCDSNTPRSARVPHRSGPLRQSFVDKSKHDGFSAIPPSTALHSERRIVATKCAVISPICHSRLVASGAKRNSSKRDVVRCADDKVSRRSQRRWR